MSTTDSPPAAPKPSRRRYQYSLRTLLLLPTVLALVLSAIYSWPYAERRDILWRLQDYLDKDLRRCRTRRGNDIDQWIAKLIGSHKPIFLGHENWLLHAADSSEDGRVIYLIEMEPTQSIPGESYCCVHARLTPAACSARQGSNLGNRNWPTTAACDETQHGFLCLTVETKAWMVIYGKRFYYIVG